MLTATGPGGDYSFVYDSLNLPTQINEPNGVVTYTYNVVGQPTRMVETTGSSSLTVNYSYDSLGRLKQITNGSGNNMDTYTYDPAGYLVGEAKGNGTSTTYQYNADGELVNLTNFGPGGTTVNSSFAYIYNSVDEVTSMTTGGTTTNYGYDADGQLTSVKAPGESIAYAYDASGNRTSVTQNGVVTTYTANSVNEYTSIGATTYGYDADGNMTASTTAGVTTKYTYNSLNQLTGASSPSGTYSYVYDPLGDPISTSFTATATQTTTVTDNLYDGDGNLIGQIDGSGGLIAFYTYGDDLLESQVDSSGAAAYYDFDIDGSTVGITGKSGIYVNQYTYDPFGQTTTVTASLENPFTYAGQFGVTSDGSGLLQMGFRSYDPATGQFVSNDPAGLAGGDINLRTYVGNQPTDFIDPSGLKRQKKPTGGQSSGKKKPPPPVCVTCVLRQAAAAAAAIGNGIGYAANQLGNALQQWANDASNTLRNGLHGIGLGDPPGCGAGGGGTGCEVPPQQPSSPTSPVAGGSTKIVIAADPNDITGPSGIGAASFISSDATLPYTIDFENLPTATAPAQTVTVTQQLSPNLDWSTFQLGAIEFGSTVVNVPAGETSYITTIDATATLGLFVDVSAGINLSTGKVTWTFTSIDPATLDLTSNPLAGFLPPDKTSPEGEGSVSYTIKPRANLASGTVVSALATVVFDTNAPINTPTLDNAIDVTRPTSSVSPLPPTTASTAFTVSWSGSDPAGPGIAAYNVFVSDDGGPFTLWQSDTSVTSAIYTGQVGHTYAFYSVATDQLGLVQPTPVAQQATIAVINTPPPPPPSLVTVESFRVETIKVGAGRKAKKETVLVLQFGGALNASAADNAGAYDLAPIIKVKASGKGKHRKPASTKLGSPVKLASAVYTASNNEVTLTPRIKLSGSKPEELIVIGTLLTDTLGRQIDGANDGVAGSDYIATITGSKVTTGGIPLARVQPTPRDIASAVDQLLAPSDFDRLPYSPRALALARHAATALEVRVGR